MIIYSVFEIILIVHETLISVVLIDLCEFYTKNL